MTAALDPKLAAEALAAFEKHGNIQAAADSLKLHRATFTNRLQRARAISGKVEEPISLREKRRYEDSIASLRQQLIAAQREANEAEDLRSTVFKLSEQPLNPPAWSQHSKRVGKSKPGIPVLFFSDAQWGEVIRKEELDGVNEFNLAIAAARYRMLIDKTIELATEHMVNPDYPGIYYLRGGDMVSGDIHQELRETNDAGSLLAVKDLVENEITGIARLAATFKRVHVISIPGNHGRQTIKPMSKRYAEANYDTLSAWMLEMHFKAQGASNITFDTPASGEKLFAIYRYNFLLTHGDRIGSRGGQGMIGPVATITRGMKKLVDYYATLNHRIDYCLVGHFHTRSENEYGLSNGCLPGISEYSRDGRFRPRAPEQWFFFVHPAHGITARWPISLAPRPELPSNPLESLK